MMETANNYNSKVSSHNTMTFLKPKKLWMYLGLPFAKCQSKNLVEQYLLGIRSFDLRIAFNPEDGVPYFRHGFIKFKGDVYEVLTYLDNLPANINVRLVLECLNKDEELVQSILFKKFYEDILVLFPNLNFWELTVKYNWKRLIDKEVPKYEQFVSSMKAKGLLKVLPWLYAKLNNKKVINKIEKGELNDYKFIFIDFI